MKRRDTTACFDGCAYLSVLRSSESAVGLAASGSAVCGVAPSCDSGHLAVMSVYCTETMHVLQLSRIVQPTRLFTAQKSCPSFSYCKSFGVTYTSV